MVHKIEETSQVNRSDAAQVQHWVMVRGPPNHISKGRTASCQNDTMSLHLMISTDECHIEKVFIIAQVFECSNNVLLKVLPPQAKVLFHTCAGIISCRSESSNI